MMPRPSPVLFSPALCFPLRSPRCGHSQPVPLPQEAFWCLVQICEVYLPGYYGPHMVRGWRGSEGTGEGLGRQAGRGLGTERGSPGFASRADGRTDVAAGGCAAGR